MDQSLSELSLDTITELHPLRITFKGGGTKMYFHDQSTDNLYFLRLGHARLSLFGTFRNIRLTTQDLLFKGTLAELADVMSIQKL